MGEAKGTALQTIIQLFNNIAHRLLFKVMPPPAGNLADIAGDQSTRSTLLSSQHTYLDNLCFLCCSNVSII